MTCDQDFGNADEFGGHAVGVCKGPSLLTVLGACALVLARKGASNGCDEEIVCSPHVLLRLLNPGAFIPKD